MILSSLHITKQNKPQKGNKSNMKHSILAVFGLAALMLAGCSSTPTKVDTGTIHAKTFSFVARQSTDQPGFADTRAPIHAMIQEAITRNMEAKGVEQVDTGADVIVAYLVIVGNNATTEAISTYFGYGRDAAALQDEAHEAYTENKNPSYFEAGTLLVDIIDAKSYKLLKRTYVTRPLFRDATAEVRQENIQKAVDDLFKTVRIEP
jgi:hypothetical protein